MTKTRGFEAITSINLKPFMTHTIIPTRSDVGSAGYDFYSNENFKLESGCHHLFWTNVKSYMQQDEVLEIYPRSSLGTKGIILANTVGIIDSTYYNNKDNEGNIGIMLKNIGTTPIEIKIGDRIAQGIFKKFLVADNDTTLNTERLGGFGSSGK